MFGRLQKENGVNGVTVKTRDFQVVDVKERETGIEPATSSLGNWASIENKQQWRLLRPFLNTSTRPVSRFCLFSPS